MKNALLALALCAFVGTASAHEGEKGKKAKKTTAATEAKGHCDMAGSMGSAGTPACCMKKGSKTAAATPAPAATPVKSL